MPQKSERVRELEQGLLEIGETIDTCDQSRVALSDGMDNVREKVVELYGEDFEKDLLELMGYEVEENDDETEQ